MERSSLIAIMLALAAYAAFNIGAALQKKGAAGLPKIHRTPFFGNLKNFITSRVWMIGFLLTCLQWWLLTLALDFGSLSLVSPLRGAGIVVLALFSRFYLRETLYPAERLGIALIVIGIVGIGVFNIEQAAEVGFSEMNRYMAERDSVVLFFVLAALTVIPMIISAKSTYRHADVAFGVASGILLGLGVFFTKAIMAGVDMKALKPSLAGAVQSLPWWLYLFAVVLCNTLSMVTQQVGFQHGRAIIVIPLFTITGILVPVVTGIVILDEWAGFSNRQAYGVLGSLLVLTIGIVVMSLKLKPKRTGNSITGTQGDQGCEGSE